MQVFYEVRVSLWETCGINMVELVPWGAISLWFIWGSWIWSIKLLNRVWWEAFLTDEGGGCVFGYDGTKHLYTVYETERKHAVVATEDFASHVPSASMTKWKMRVLAYANEHHGIIYCFVQWIFLSGSRESTRDSCITSRTSQHQTIVAALVPPLQGRHVK